MRYSDIEQFPYPSYSVDVMWRYLEGQLDNYKDIGLELNPYFQRGHIWSKKQQIKYVEFILKRGLSGKDIYFNCKGWMKSFKGPMVCVDGLQRITAVQMFMDNKLAVFGNNYLEDFEDRMSLTASFKFHINDIESDKDILKWYLWMNEGGTPHSAEELNKIRQLLNKR